MLFLSLQIKRYIVRPTMDLSKDPLNSDLFKLTSPGELENYQSLNIQIQHHFNSIYHPNSARIVSKFNLVDPTKMNRNKEANEILEDKRRVGLLVI